MCPPLSSATSLRRAHCFLTGGSPGVTRPLGAQQLASRTNAATLQHRLLTEAKRPSGSHKEQHRGSGVACSRTTGIWFDAQRTGRLQLQFLWGMKYSREEAGGAGLALVRQMESGGGRPGRWEEGKGGRPAAHARGHVQGRLRAAVLISKKGNKVGRGNDSGGTLSSWCTHRDSTGLDAVMRNSISSQIRAKHNQRKTRGGVLKPNHAPRHVRKENKTGCALKYGCFVLSFKHRHMVVPALALPSPSYCHRTGDQVLVNIMRKDLRTL